MANAIYAEVIRQSDYGIDFHSAAVRRTNYPNVRADVRDEKTKMLAEAFGCELIVNSKGPTGSLRRTAGEAGVPTIVLEAGEVWKIEPGVVEIGVRGCVNVLRALDMMEGAPKPPAFQVTVKKAVWVRADLGGILMFHATPGQLVEEGESLATSSSIFGKEQASLVSPVNGIVLGMTTMPAVKPGAPVYHIAVLSKKALKRVRDRIEKRSHLNPYTRIQEDLATNVTVQDP